MKPLKDKIAVVAGATRGAGRGIACMLGEVGATVYCTGRSSRAKPTIRPAGDAPFELEGRPETIEETAELVDRYGGVGIAVRVDHTVEADVERLFERVSTEQGRLDILVNDIWGGDALTEWGRPFWELSIDKGLLMQQRAVHTHIITSRHAAPLMVARRRGLIVEITDGDSPGYRGNLFYDLAKSSAIRLAYAMAEELRPHDIAALAVTPGFLRSEAMLEHFGVTEANWRDGAKRDPHFIASETPFYVGRAIATLAADPNIAQKSGGAFSSWVLAEEYSFTDIDGRRPNWGKYYAEHVIGQ
ncbi:MAG TPA: SDR family oxidoreductase [Roseiflexaceae bacterium]|nr:SDR family oxidoreductase [Roseiflexaceae bacterium]